jgi:UPF0755 protein
VSNYGDWEPSGPSRRSGTGPRMLARVLAFVAVLAALAVGIGAAALAMRAVSSPTAAEGEEEAATTVAQPPPPPPLKIVFPEGFTREEMAQRITVVNGIAKEKRNINPRLTARAYRRLTEKHALPGRFAGDRKQRPLEGFLFPATYEFLPATTTRELVDMQLETFEREWKKIDLRHARSKNLTPYDVLIIASMVEKETTVAKERPLVAAVIYNRLRMGMPLGIDATIRYGLDVPGDQSLRQSHLQSDNPYNTRNRLGLPPTPIANPGLASMQAAAKPANVNHLYFLRKPDSVEHFFTASESEFFRKACEYGYGCG